MIEKLEFLSLLTDNLLKIELNPKVALENFQIVAWTFRLH